MNTEEFYNGSPYEAGTMDNLAEIKQEYNNLV